jgi:hypothetical protein
MVKIPVKPVCPQAEGVDKDFTVGGEELLVTALNPRILEM